MRNTNDFSNIPSPSAKGPTPAPSLRSRGGDLVTTHGVRPHARRENGSCDVITTYYKRIDFQFSFGLHN